MNEKQPKNRGDPTKTIEVLFRISDAVSNTRNLDELYRAIHKSLDEILNVDNFYIAIHHEDRDSITFPYHVDEQDDNPDEIFNFSRTASLTGQVISERKPLIFPGKRLRKKKNTRKKGSRACSRWPGLCVMRSISRSRPSSDTRSCF